MDPDAITRTLEMVPSHTHRTGDEVISKSARKAVRRASAWVVHSEDRLNSGALEDHLDFLWGALGDQGDLRCIPGVQKVILTIVTISKQDPSLFFLDNDNVQRIAEIGATLNVEAYE
ncbi:MAG: DUF4279 domain-containing protein [Paracoccaceae bacterium]